MLKTRPKIKELLKKVLIKNRLIILNEDTFEEIFSFRLNLMNVFVLVTAGSILLILLTTFVISFTPLREFIPGYTSSKLKRQATELALKSDSLTLALKKNEAYINAVKKVLTGKLEYAKFNKDSIIAATPEPVNPSDLEASAAEIELRKEVAKEDKAHPNLPKRKEQKSKKNQK